MKKLLFCIFIFSGSFNALAGTGPTSLGPIHVGMSKMEYISATKINPVDCNSLSELRDEFKYLLPDKKTLCFGFASEFVKTGSIENIKVSGLSYSVIEAGYEASQFIHSLGNRSKAFFIKDRLISLEIYAPKVSIQTLIAKYGSPKINDRRKIEVCTNGMGNKFDNNVGKVDAVWVNDNVQSILRSVTSSPRETCTDGSTLQYYILEEPKQLKQIESAINRYRESLSKKAVNESPF